MFDITKKRANETARIELIDGEGAPLTDEEGNVLAVTVFGPGSKRWQQADAERNRKRTQRLEKNRRNLAAAIEGSKDDEVEFLVSITQSFDGWIYPAPKTADWSEGDPDPAWPTSAQMYRAAYDDDTIGFIREHVHSEASSWGAFTKG